MYQAQTIILLDLVLIALIGADLARTLQTGRARGRSSAITRRKRPKQYWRYVYASCAVLMVCAVVLLWVMISPKSF